MNLQNIAKGIQLTTLNTSCWRASKVNRPETAKVNDAHGTGNKAHVRVRVCEHPALAAITKLHSRVYADHLSMTRPSIMDGTRLLPNSKALEHAEMIRAARVEHDALVTQFLADYENERDQAPIALNGLYDPSAWPSLASIRDKFALTVRYLPCPVDGAWAEWLEESARAATSELREQIELAVKRVQDRCMATGERLYSTVFTGLRELLASVPDLDIADDSEIRRLAELARPLASIEKDDIVDDDAARHRVAAQARDVLDMFGAGSLAL